MIFNNKLQKLYAILIIRTQNVKDFCVWIKWYEHFIKCDKIVIINDNSDFSLLPYINQYNNIILIPALYDNYIQKENYNIIIYNILKPNKNDIILIPDADEFWWYDTKKFISLQHCLNAERERLKTNCICVPWVNLMSPELLKSRPWDCDFTQFCTYRIGSEFIEYKPIIFYDENCKIENIHYGLSDYKVISEKSEHINIFGKVLYDYHLRLYHYRITTIDEYQSKLRSCLNKKVLVNNKRFYMNEDINTYLASTNQYPYKEDLTVLNTLKTI